MFIIRGEKNEDIKNNYKNNNMYTFSFINNIHIN